MNADRLLKQSCTWYAFTGQTEDANLEHSPSYASGVALACMADQPSARWLTRWPNMKQTGSVVLWLPHDATVAAKDKITFSGHDYKVTDVASWPDTGMSALCERVGGTDA